MNGYQYFFLSFACPKERNKEKGRQNEMLRSFCLGSRTLTDYGPKRSSVLSYKDEYSADNKLSQREALSRRSASRSVVNHF